MAISAEDAARMADRIIERSAGDSEIAHIRLDGLLCEVLISLGYEDLVAKFHEQSKWYA